MVFVGDALLAHAKASCYRCGRGDNLVDFDVQIEGEGALAICKFCIGEAAEVAGLHLNSAAVAEMRAAFEDERRHFSPERALELEDEIAKLVAQVAIVEAQKQALTEALAARETTPRATKSK